MVKNVDATAVCGIEGDKVVLRLESETPSADNARLNFTAESAERLAGDLLMWADRLRKIR